MKKSNSKLKVLACIVIGFICFIFITSFIVINTIFTPPISKNKMKKEFIIHKEVLIKVAEYLENPEYYSVYINSHHNKGEMSVAYNSKEMSKITQIIDNDITEYISYLFQECGYNVIIKRSNTIYFQRWSTRDYGRGVLYLISGDHPLDKSLEILVPLEESKWYFVESK